MEGLGDQIIEPPPPGACKDSSLYLKEMCRHCWFSAKRGHNLTYA